MYFAKEVHLIYLARMLAGIGAGLYTIEVHSINGWKLNFIKICLNYLYFPLLIIKHSLRKHFGGKMKTKTINDY